MALHRTILALAALGGLALAAPANAEAHREKATSEQVHGGRGYSGRAQTNAGRGYSGRAEPQRNDDFERSHRVERSGGHWFHGEHGGQQGWWWIARGMWILAPPAPAAALPGYWYWCPSAQRYYPDVTACDQPWIPVAPPPASP